MGATPPFTTEDVRALGITLFLERSRKGIQPHETAERACPGAPCLVVVEEGRDGQPLEGPSDRDGVLKTMPVEEVWGGGPQYRRCGMLLTGLAPETEQQTGLFAAES